MKLVYGPIASWRLGRSLGIDLISQEEKICSFDCIYCQLEKTQCITAQKDEFVSISQLKKEISEALQKRTADVITFSGMGEPTLASNMDEAITVIRELSDLPIALLTNSSLLYDKQVQDNLNKIDIIVAKLDAPNDELFQRINQPASGITFQNTIEGIKSMRRRFKGKFSLQTMFIEQNVISVHELVELTKEIDPDEVQINTPLRPCEIDPLSKEKLEKIERQYEGLPAISVYKSSRPVTDPLDKLDIIKRRRTE